MQKRHSRSSEGTAAIEREAPEMQHHLRSVAFIGLIGLTPIAHAQTAGNPTSGQRFALQTCTPCHVVTPDQLSPPRFAIGPDFPTIANTSGMTETALHLFLTHPHPRMPNLMLSPQEQDNVVAYILSLRTRP
jgi:mono/diheme cytochrome c family protein